MVCTRIHVLVRRLKKNGLGATCALVLACDSWVMKIDLFFSNFSEPNNFKQHFFLSGINQGSVNASRPTSSLYRNSIFLQALLHNLCIISGYDREKLLSFVINTSGAIEHTYFLVNLFWLALHWLKVCVSESFFTEFPRARIFPCWITILTLFAMTSYFLL